MTDFMEIKERKNGGAMAEYDEADLAPEADAIHDFLRRNESEKLYNSLNDERIVLSAAKELILKALIAYDNERQTVSMEMSNEMHGAFRELRRFYKEMR